MLVTKAPTVGCLWWGLLGFMAGLTHCKENLLDDGMQATFYFCTQLLPFRKRMSLLFSQPLPHCLEPPPMPVSGL
jgi:hypothetical protein